MIDPITGARTVTVEFPDGPREVIPSAWHRSEGFPDMPIFDFPVVETIDGRHIAVRDR